MSLNANPLLYINMGGEMIYVLHQRLKAQKVNADKTIQVLDEVTAALVNPDTLSMIFEKGPNLGLPFLRGTLEGVILSSIMKLDESSMNKLFDLMMMMVKYQLTVATGPREVILLTLNHVDALRDTVTHIDSAQENISLLHKMIIDTYGELTYDEIWEARNACLNTLESINVRVSILLRLGLQNEDTTFNLKLQNYNEKFNERQTELGGLKLSANTCRGCNIGSLQELNGDRVTHLGKNIYSPGYGRIPKPKATNRVREQSLKDRGTKAELGMLAVQLGTEEGSTITRPFSLNLFDDPFLDLTLDDNKKSNTPKPNKSTSPLEDTTKIDADYKAKLDNVRADLFDNDHIDRKMNLLQLLDEAE